MNQKTINRNDLQDICDAANIDGDALRTDYSGRGMYGDECIGLTLDGVREFGLFAVAAATWHAESVEMEMEPDWDPDSFIGNVRVDGMGRSEIYYFPRYRVTDDTQER